MRKTVAAATAVVCVAASATATASGPDSPFHVASRLPAGYQLLLTTNTPGERLHMAQYGPATLLDVSDAPLWVSTQFDGPSPGRLEPVVQRREVELNGRSVPADQAETVQGHSGVLRILTDDGRAYARALLWLESPGVAVGVGAPLSMGVDELRAIAAGVHSVDAAEWGRLSTATSLAGQVGFPLISRMRRVVAARGTVAGKPWQLMALVPSRYPLGPEDRRIACTELRVGSKHSFGGGCLWPNLRRIGGRTFVFGQADRQTRRVAVSPIKSNRVIATAPTHAVNAFAPTRFYAVLLPEGTCSASVKPIGRKRDLHLGPTGPLRRTC